MGKYKLYVEELANKLGKDFDEVTQLDIEFDFMKQAQRVFSDEKSTPEDRERFKTFLPKISLDVVSDFYKVGDVFIQENSLSGDKNFYLISN